MLQLGSSKEWPDALEALTGGRVMDASVIREYFKPLEMWLKQDNEKHGEFVGWEAGKEGEHIEGCWERRNRKRRNLNDKLEGETIE